MTTDRLTLGQRLDDITTRMSAAYEARFAAQKLHGGDSPQYLAADEELEAVYVDLRAWNAEAAGGCNRDKDGQVACARCTHPRGQHWQHEHVCQVCQDAGSDCHAFVTP